MMSIKTILCTSSTLIFALAVSCTWNQLSPQLDCSTSPVELELVESNSATCGAANGNLTMKASGGEPPYVYTLLNEANSDGLFVDLIAGIYEVVATDANGCSTTLEVPIQNQNGVNLEGIEVLNSGCNISEGSITINAVGGEEPYLYSLDGTSAQSSNVFSGLNKGTYAVSVQDQLGCETSQTVEILTGVSYESSVKSIIANTCATTGCHNGNISPDFRSFNNIQAKAASIKTRTGNRSMPKGRSLTQEQIDIIACWVDDGALAN